MIRAEDFKINTAIFEIKYKNGELYWDRCGSILRKWKGDEDGNWQISSEGARIEWLKGKQIFFYNWQRAGTEAIALPNLSKFKESSKQFIRDIIEILEIEECYRVGARIIFISPIEDAGKYTRLISDAVGLTEEQWSLVGDEPIGIKIALASADNNLKLKRNVQISIGQRRMFPSFMRDRFEEYREYAPDIALIFDVDLYTDEPVDSSSVDPALYIQRCQKSFENQLINILRRGEGAI
jgi:hypothetical protein